MNTFDYYRQFFPRHRDELLQGEAIISHFPLPLATLPPEFRPHFVACLFIQVLADQAVHWNFPTNHREFEAATLFPKMGSGLAAGYPHYLLEESTQRGDVSVIDLIGPLFSALVLMFSECDGVFTKHVPQIALNRFYEALLADTHVRRWSSTNGPEVLRIAFSAMQAAFESYAFLKRA